MKNSVKSYGFNEYWYALLIEMKTFSGEIKLRTQIRRERRELEKLDARGLMDIGISHEDATREANRSFSDIPSIRASRYKRLS